MKLLVWERFCFPSDHSDHSYNNITDNGLAFIFLEIYEQLLVYVGICEKVDVWVASLYQLECKK